MKYNFIDLSLLDEWRSRNKRLHSIGNSVRSIVTKDLYYNSRWNCRPVIYSKSFLWQTKNTKGYPLNPKTPPIALSRSFDLQNKHLSQKCPKIKSPIYSKITSLKPKLTFSTLPSLIPIATPKPTFSPYPQNRTLTPSPYSPLTPIPKPTKKPSTSL